MTFAETRPAILALGAANPPYQFDQMAVCEWVGDSLNAPPPLRRWLRRLYELSGITTRFSCLPDAAALDPLSPFAPGRTLAETPTTAERMAIYQAESVRLGRAAATEALAQPGAFPAEEITHLIIVSCTGFFAPGLDLAIARELGLRPDVQRTLVGFMGCAAAFNGLRLAAQIVAAQPAARVLVVCVELCTLHLQPGADRVALTVASLFADGAAACLVGAEQPGAEQLLIDRFYTHVAPETTGAMAWQIGNHGFVMDLSPEVPRYVERAAPLALAELLGDAPLPEFWAIHPGGRAIVERLAAALGLSAEQTAASYAVLRAYGNMSSPTVLFVLRELLGRLRAAPGPTGVVAAAFGPGLVTELAHLTYTPAETLSLPGRQVERESTLTVARTR